MTPTAAELAILRILWAHGPSTVRQVHEVLAADRPLAYTTALKTMQIMTEKGLVVREESGRQHVYRARFRQRDTQGRLVRDLVDRAFGGSLPQLVMQALATRRASPEELREIRRLIAAAEKQSKEKDHE